MCERCIACVHVTCDDTSQESLRSTLVTELRTLFAALASTSSDTRVRTALTALDAHDSDLTALAAIARSVTADVRRASKSLLGGRRRRDDDGNTAVAVVVDADDDVARTTGAQRATVESAWERVQAAHSAFVALFQW
jgi:hypothetical protein